MPASTVFVTVAQRRLLNIDDALLPVFGPLYAIETHMSMEERTTLGMTALRLPVGFIACEIGSYVGASTSFIAGAASLRQGVLHCVDTWDNRAMGAETPRDTYAEFMQNTERFRSHIIPHRGEAAAMADQVPSGLDLLFLDGDHSYDATKSDLIHFVPKLKPGGLLLCHDVQYATVKQAIEEYFSTRPVIQVGTTHTLLVLQMPANP